MFDNQSIFITGGTGSFGRAFVKHLLSNYKPKLIVIYSRDELKQFELQQELPDPILRFMIGDIRDLSRLNTALHGIDLVIHAAALKQIPAAEYNPIEYIKTNILGTQNVIQSAIRHKVKKVISLSTDKAVNPINLYGATKLAADRLVIAANNLNSPTTLFSVVRYGNVMGSRGSVLPLFKKLLASGVKVLPVTEARMTRFWITLEQSVQFIIETLLRMQGGEIFIPKLPSANILHLISALSETAQFKLIGIRPGEKLHEILCTKDDAYMTYEFPDHYMIASAMAKGHTEYAVNGLNEKGYLVQESFEYNSEKNPWILTVDDIRELLKENVSHYVEC